MKGPQARTEQGEFCFKVKEGADGTPWVYAEPLRETMPALKNAFIGFGLPRGTTLPQAERIAKRMNENLVTMSMTIFDTHPLYNQV